MVDVMGYPKKQNLFNLLTKNFSLWDNKFALCEENIARAVSFSVRPRGGAGVLNRTLSPRRVQLDRTKFFISKLNKFCFFG